VVLIGENSLIQSKSDTVYGPCYRIKSTAHKYGMNVLRATHSQVPINDYTVVLEVSHLKTSTVDMLYVFIEAWLKKHCHQPWDLIQFQEVDRTPEHNVFTYFRIVFSDLHEAIYFKLSPNLLYSKPEHPLALDYKLEIRQDLSSFIPFSA
jgi:hypothetical protein